MRSLSAAAAEPSENANHEPPSQPREADALAPDFELDGRYRVVRPLGRGGMGQVYEAQHIRLARRVALKVLRSSMGTSLEVRKRFEREAQAIAQVESDHVVKVFDFGLAPGNQLYLVMEYLAGRDLRDILREEGSLAAPRAARLMHDACLGLSAAHARGVIHRDLKPENLIVVRRADGAEMCKVVDFGLAKVKASSVSDAQTKAGIAFGTLHYMSPEQARGDSDIDERTDVYGCCAVLYEMLTGQRPHTADSAHALLYKIIHETPRRADQTADAFMPTALADLVERGLQGSRARRFPSMQALALALEPLMGARAVASGTPSPAVGNPIDETQPTSRRAPSPKAALRQSNLRGWAPLVASAALGGTLTWLASVGRQPSNVAAPNAVAPVVTAAALPSTPPSEATPSAALRVAPVPSMPASPALEADALGSHRQRVPTSRRALTTGGVPALSAAAGAHGFERQNPYE
jgi:serine/threonine protein kinase